MAPVDTGAGRVGVTDTGGGDIPSICQPPGVPIHVENRLVHGVEQIQVVTGSAIQFP